MTIQATTTTSNKIAPKLLKKSVFKFISPGTPQKNGVIEWVFDKLYYWMRAMMVHMVMHNNLNTALFTKYTTTRT